MTRQNRELSIEDNIAYVGGVLRQLLKDAPREAKIVWTGFSQGVAMAFRAAAFLSPVTAGVITCGGDVPPELDTQHLQRVPAALIGRGLRDEWYTDVKLASDEQRLRSAGVDVRPVAIDAAHEWTPSFSEISGRFLNELTR
jgi:dienelactone hydrolase